MDARIRTVAMFETPDGARWKSVEGAETRLFEMDCCEVAVARIGLRPPPSSTDYANGGGYIQQPKGSRASLYQFLSEMDAHRDSVGPIGDLLHRAMRIDDNDREWGQAYFALHPNEGKQVEVSSNTGG